MSWRFRNKRRNRSPSAYFEVAFGGMSLQHVTQSRLTGLELTRSTFVGEETMKISGQIDRVDVAGITH